MELSLKEALTQAIHLLNRTPEATIEAQTLLCGLLQVPRSYLLAYPEKPLPEEQANAFFALIKRRQQGEPVAYLLGQREFWGLSLTVTPATLIPRHETELLVEYLLGLADSCKSLRLADLGTGCGTIALSLAKARPHWDIWATDQSLSALAVAKNNAKALDITAVHFGHGDWFTPLTGLSFDWIVSNPPYIAENDLHLSTLSYEPLAALVSGPEGLDAIRHIILGSGNHLVMGGGLMLEHGFDQGAMVRELLQNAGFTDIQTIKDYSGLERVTWGFKK